MVAPSPRSVRPVPDPQTPRALAVAPQTLLLDLDGTLVTPEGVIPGADDALARLRADGHRLLFLTNTDSQATTALRASLGERGLAVGGEELVTPVVAAAGALADVPDARVLLLASDAVREELAARLRLVDAGERATHVVVGDVRATLSYPLLDAAFAALHAGARLVALQKGPFFLAGGAAHLDTGAVVAALEYAARVEALVVGKPSPAFAALALRSLTEPPDPARTWVVGDDATSDVAMGLAAGLRTVQVRTGKHALQADDDALPRPEHVIDSIADLPDLLRELAG